MAGQQVPLVMLPRFTTFAGRHEYTTVPIDVSEFSKAVLTCWRGPGQLGDGGVSLNCQESSDQNTWVACSGTNVSFDPGSGMEGVAIATLKRRWFRMKVILNASAPFQDSMCVTCWAVGNLVRREP